MCDNATKYGFLGQNRTFSPCRRLNKVAVSHIESFFKKIGLALDKPMENEEIHEMA